MVRGLILLLVCFLLYVSGCRSLAPIQPESQALREDTARQCRAHFLTRPRQMVQSLTAYLPGGDVKDAIAVIRIHPEAGRIKCVIMSVEGFVLFNGEYDGGVSIRRAVPPFDKEKFARAMFADIRLAFISPEASDVEVGTLSGGAPICRYACSGDKGFVEVRLSGADRLEIRRYTGGKKLRETVNVCYPPACGSPLPGGAGEVPAKINIFHHGLFDYRLELNLLEAKELPQD
ncbi:MAG: hypothetical protein R6U41_08320 [Desulfosalsimonas sp.]|uniref:hypothetical protein n=1 Tax=Desulfosalsimonas sp. TaxID=3073848 RepID=UPI003970BC0A